MRRARNRIVLLDVGRAVSIALMLAVAIQCGPRLPPSYSARAQRAADGAKLQEAVIAFSRTAINLNALPAGQPGHLTDQDTRHVRDLALAIDAGVLMYVEDGRVLGIVRGVDAFNRAISVNAKSESSVQGRAGARAGDVDDPCDWLDDWRRMMGAGLLAALAITEAAAPMVMMLMSIIKTHVNATGTFPTEEQIIAGVAVNSKTLRDTWAAWDAAHPAPTLPPTT